MSKHHHPGTNQVPGGKCLDHWHCTYNDRLDHGCSELEAFNRVGGACPSCGAINMPGGAVTPEFAVEYQRRLHAKICLVSRGGIFECPRPASAAALAGGACLCARHDR